MTNIFDCINISTNKYQLQKSNFNITIDKLKQLLYKNTLFTLYVALLNNKTKII